MQEKLQKILEEIKSGKRKYLFDVDISDEEYLSKDSEGITFLERLFENKIEPPIYSASNIKTSAEIAYIYVKNNKTLYFFELKEEDLFSNINGKLFIDYIVEQKKLSKNIINVVKDHIEIVDMVISSNIFQLDYLSEEIMDKLMTKYPNGIYPIEKHINDNNNIMERLIPLINDSSKLIELCQKYNNYDWLEHANEKVLMNEISKNETILNYLIKNQKIPNKLLNIPPNVDFVNFLRKNNLYKYLSTASEEVLLLNIGSNKTLLEELIELNQITKLKNIDSEETIQILYKYNKLEMLSDVRTYLLLKPVDQVLAINDSNNITLLEFLLDKGYNPIIDTYSLSNEKIIKILYDRQYYELLAKKLDEENFLKEIYPGEKIIEKLLDNNIDVNVEFETKEFAKILFDRKRFDLLIKGDIQVLLSSVDVENTYFDFILENIKNKKIKHNICKFHFYGCSVNEIARFYLSVAKHDMMEYIKPLEESELLNEYNGKTLLDELLDLNSDLTFNKILNKKLKRKLPIAVVLKARGLEPVTFDIPLEQKSLNKQYLDDFQNSMGIGPQQYEGQYLLKKLEDLFMNDGASDPELISALVKGYRNALIINYDLNIQELRNLVYIKENNKNKFLYLKDEDGAYFSRGSVYCDNNTIDTLLHETGHALHDYLTNKNVPDEYNAIVERIRKNPDILSKVEKYSNDFDFLYSKIESYVEEKYKDYFEMFFSEEKTEAINKFLASSKEEKRADFISLGIPEETLDFILEEIFTVEEYIETQKRIFIKENVDSIIRSEYGSLAAIGDILDAIYEGSLYSGALENKNGEKIKRTYGHGISYYYDQPHGFDEMVANLSAILKSNNSKQTLDELKNIVGEELVNLLIKFYYDNMLSSKEYNNENSIILGGI